MHMSLIRQAERLQLSTLDCRPARQTQSSAVHVMMVSLKSKDSELCTPEQEAGGWRPAGQAR